MTNALRPCRGATLRLRARQGVARLTALLLMMTAAGAGLTAGATLAAAAITTPFAQVYSINTTGDIQIRGNTLMTCQTAVADCTTSRDTAGGSAASNGVLNDNNYWMVNVDIDSDLSTFNSSSSTVDLPAGASVLYAGLVWGGRPGCRRDHRRRRGSRGTDPRRHEQGEAQGSWPGLLQRPDRGLDGDGQRELPGLSRRHVDRPGGRERLVHHRQRPERAGRRLVRRLGPGDRLLRHQRATAEPHHLQGLRVGRERRSVRHPGERVHHSARRPGTDDAGCRLLRGRPGLHRRPVPARPEQQQPDQHQRRPARLDQRLRLDHQRQRRRLVDAQPEVQEPAGLRRSDLQRRREPAQLRDERRHPPHVDQRDVLPRA